MKNALYTLCLFVGFIPSALAQATIDIERIFESPSLSGISPTNVQVSPDGTRVTFTRGKSSDFDRYDLWEYNIASGKTQILFDADDLQSSPVALSDEEKARRERMRVYGSGIISYQWSNDGKALIFPLGGDVFYYRIGDQHAQQLLDTPEFETDIKLSPKGNYISFIRAQNLYIKEIKSGKEIALTQDGGGVIKYGMAEFVAQEEMSRRTGYWWSPDENHIAFTKVDESPVEVITRSEIYAERIEMIEQRYPKAGTANVTIDLGLVNLGNKQVTWIDLSDDADIYLPRVKWMNADTLTYQVQSRDQQTLTLFSYKLDSKQKAALLQERNDTWINLHSDLRFLSSAPQFIWASERDGFKHLYLYNQQGELLRQLTAGAWVVDSIRAVDEKKDLVYFQGRKDSVLESHLYSVPISGGKITRISEAGRYHSVSFSQDASVYVSTHSTINEPPKVSLHKANGKHITWLTENKIDDKHPLKPYQDQWVSPSFGTLKADDGTDLHYRLYKPQKITGKHPVIVYLYAGPIAQVVTNKWAGNRGLLMQHWVSKGYVVFSLDNRGSNYRGKAFENPIYKSMGSVEVDDQIAGVKFLRSLDFVDPNRIGVHGHSYGGYMTLMTMFKAPEYFAVGVSGAPVTDWRLYDTHYTERYMGMPDTDAKAYEASSVFPYAADIKGDLLIYHGMADDNVLFTHSTMLYKHLQDRGIPFSVMDYPGKKHSIRGKQTGIHLYRTITNFFDSHL